MHVYVGQAHCNAVTGMHRAVVPSRCYSSAAHLPYASGGFSCNEASKLRGVLAREGPDSYVAAWRRSQEHRVLPGHQAEERAINHDGLRAEHRSKAVAQLTAWYNTLLQEVVHCIDHACNSMLRAWPVAAQNSLEHSCSDCARHMH
jgi:hypothetical protein